MIQRSAARLQLSNANVKVGSTLVDETVPPKLRDRDDQAGARLLRHLTLKLKAPAASRHERDHAIAVVPVPLQLNVIDTRGEDAMHAAVSLDRLAVRTRTHQRPLKLRPSCFL